VDNEEDEEDSTHSKSETEAIRRSSCRALKVRPHKGSRIEEDSNVLTVFSEWINKLAGERIERIYSGFNAYEEPLLMSTMIDDKIIPRWQKDFSMFRDGGKTFQCCHNQCSS
jgi:hypothetical protein